MSVNYLCNLLSISFINKIQSQNKTINGENKTRLLARAQKTDQSKNVNRGEYGVAGGRRIENPIHLKQ